MLCLDIKNSLFISLCILKDLPQQKNPRVLCQGNSPNLFLHMEIFLQKEKEGRKFKKSCFCKGRF
jgi:hypothetical protein